MWAGLNWWRFGSPLQFGYLRDATPEFGGGVSSGVQGLLFSGYASLLLYCPVVLLAIPGLRALHRRRPAAAGLLITLFVLFFLLCASLGNWMGGRAYGPRYLVPLLPALVLPLAFWIPQSRLSSWVRGCVIAIGIAVQMPGVIVDYSKVRVSRARAGETVAEDMRMSRAPLLLNLSASADAVRETTHHLFGGQPLPRVTLDDTDLAGGLSFSDRFLVDVSVLPRQDWRADGAPDSGRAHRRWPAGDQARVRDSDRWTPPDAGWPRLRSGSRAAQGVKP